MSGQLLLPVGVTPMNRKRRMDSSTYRTSEPTLYLLIHLLIISIRGIMTQGAFLVRDNRILNGPLGRSLRSFARTAHSAHSLCSTPLRYARFARSLRSRARSLTSFTPSWDSCNS